MAVGKSGQIVLFKFPQTDLAVGKSRSSLLIAPLPSSFDDWLVCMISTQVRQAITNVDELISPRDVDFVQSGLKAESVFRLTRLAVFSESIFLGTIGEISASRLSKIKKRLATWIETS
jgi:mRNA interferase MazF